MMKKSVSLLVLSFAILFFFAGCSAKNKETLYLYNWCDFMDDSLLSQFTEETGIQVVTDYFDTNETMFAKMQAGATGYDVIIPSAYMVEILNTNGMLMELDHSKLPNLKNLDPAFLAIAPDSKSAYSVLYTVSTTGIGVLKSQVGDLSEISWGIFGDTRFAGRMTMLNDMRESLGAALKYLGYSLNSTSVKELEEARDQLIIWKKNLAKWDSELYKNGLASKEFSVSHGYSGVVLQAQQESDDVMYLLPKEGVTLNVECMVIPENASNPEAAYKFINFILDKDAAAKNTTFICYLAPNTPSYSLLEKDVLNNPAIFIPDSVMANSEVLMDLGEANALYSRVWEEVKDAQ
jgi:spermidine/putrescine transport system substrate-binding protein